MHPIAGSTREDAVLGRATERFVAKLRAFGASQRAQPVRPTEALRWHVNKGLFAATRTKRLIPTKQHDASNLDESSFNGPLLLAQQGGVLAILNVPVLNLCVIESKNTGWLI